MRLKLTIFALMFLFLGVLVKAQVTQDTINYLVITEWRGDNTHLTYLELTNKGNDSIQLSRFKIGSWGGGSTIVNGQTSDEDYWIPVDSSYKLAPGKSFLLAAWNEYSVRKYNDGFYDDFSERDQQQNVLEAADILVDLEEGLDDGTDMATPGLSGPFNEQWGPGANGFFIEYHFPNGDSILVDQVCGMFTGENGQNLDRTSAHGGYDVAGVLKGTGNSYLIRRNNVTKGNLDFANARGTGLDDSEWIPIPIHGSSWRSAPWTVGNQGDFNLDATTLESANILVDFANKKLTVPWGVRRGDNIMEHFTKKPGIGWEYIVGPVDSLSHAVQTGDQLVVYVCGNDLDKAVFDIVAADPSASANVLVPVSNEDPNGGWRDAFESGSMDWPRIMEYGTGKVDTISGVRKGIPFATRVDSLLERLQKPSNSQWLIVYAGEEKPDLSHGDKIKVTAQNGSVKEYFIKMRDYEPSRIAKLNAISWPDIPEFYKGLFGWQGDTIPNFGPEIFNYSIIVPQLSEGIPALVGQLQDLNSKLEVKRARSLVGSPEDRTIKFIVTAENDTVVNEYNVILNKEFLPDNVQPNYADPILSEVVINVSWAGNDYLEIYNPGNQPLDLSNYMIVGYESPDPVVAISEKRATAWPMRYEKYIPGLKWEGSETWSAQQYFALPDLSVNKMLEPGDVFVLGNVMNGNGSADQDWNWPGYYQTDVQFNSFSSTNGKYVISNQWGEECDENGTPMSKWYSAHIFLFKIRNDAVRQGLKSATDPNDFELIDVIGMAASETWKVGGITHGSPFSIGRKPEINKGNPIPGAGFGPTREEAEWRVWDGDYWSALGFGWPWSHYNMESDLGKHFANPPTAYMSTVSSLSYLVSEGFSMNEEIMGVTTGTTVDDFLGNLIKPDTGQVLTLTSTASGAVLLGSALLSNNDTLTVISADSTNISKYIIDVTADGLSSNALITSTRYTVEVTTQPSGNEPGVAMITGIPYGTLLETVVKNHLKYPAGSSKEVIDNNGAYLPFQILNFDTVYVSLTVNDKVFIKVVAMDGKTSIIYQLVPESSASDAFVNSNIFSVNQSTFLIADVPLGITTGTFMAQIIPAPGATIILVDKSGFVRTNGGVALDDRLIVTSEDGTKSVVYYLSVLNPNGVYLAYLLSTVYSVDQVDYNVTVPVGTTPEAFATKITLSVGATMEILDANGNEKTSGALVAGDQVMITSGDGAAQVSYTISISTGVKNPQNSMIEMFPNPSTGILNVTGLKVGQTIKVMNSAGMVIETINVANTFEVISLDRHAAGIYLIIVGENEKLIGRYKAIKY